MKKFFLMNKDQVKFVLVDLDDTLCNYREARERARSKINQELSNIGVDQEEFWRRFKEVEPGLMQQFLQNQLTRAEYRQRRFGDLLDAETRNSLELGEKLNQIYMTEGNEGVELFQDVLPFIQHLTDQGISLALLTNGPSDGQRMKVQTLEIGDHFHQIYISEEVGHSKPDENYFQHVLSDLGIEPHQAFMVGDSLRDDCQGCQNAGIPFIWIDRFGSEEEHSGVRIESLAELHDLFS